MSEGARRSFGRYWLIGLLFFHTVNTYMDRACISSAANAMQRDLGIDPQKMGWIFGIFAIGYALFQIPAGGLADALGPRRVLAWIVGFWSLFTTLTAAAFNALSLGLIRLFFGIGEAGAYPGATRALQNWVPARERGLAQGFFHSGGRVGAAISLFLMPYLVMRIGWRLTFVVNGLIGVAWLIAWLFWFRDDPKDHPQVNAAELNYIHAGLTDPSVPSVKIPFAVIATSGNMLLAMFQYAASNITFFISLTWFQPYLVQHWGNRAAFYASIPLLVGMCAHWTAGATVTWLHSKGYPVASRRIPAMVGFAIGALGLILTTQTGGPDLLLFVLSYSLAIFGVEMTIAPSWAFCMDIGGRKSGAISGAMNMLGNLGSAFSAIIFPWFVAHVTLPWFAPTTGTANSFFVFAAFINVMAAVAWLFMDPRRKVDEQMSPAQVRVRFACFVVGTGLLVGVPLIYRLLFMT